MTNQLHQSVASILTDSATIRRDVAMLAESVNSVISLMKTIALQLDKNSNFKGIAGADSGLKSIKYMSREDLEAKLSEFDSVLKFILSSHEEMVSIS